MFSFDEIKNADIEIAEAMQDEMDRQQSHLELIASENIVSKAVMAAMGSHLTNKYAEGYPGKRYYGGCEYVDVVEELARERADGSTVLAYNQDTVDMIDPEHMKESVAKMSNGFVMPGWEPERLDRLKELFEMYKDVDAEKLFNNLVYFLEAIGPVCEKYDIKMGIHPDDPAWPIFGLPRIMTGKDSVTKLLDAVNKPYNGITLCTGSFGSNQNNDICEIIKACRGRIPFAHVRNLKYNSPRDFEEAAHLSSDGSMDMYKIMKTLYDTGFDGIIRPDHGRMIWDEVAMPGYGLYDRALGATYLNGLWEAIDKSSK